MLLYLTRNMDILSYLKRSVLPMILTLTLPNTSIAVLLLIMKGILLSLCVKELYECCRQTVLQYTHATLMICGASLMQTEQFYTTESLRLIFGQRLECLGVKDTI